MKQSASRFLLLGALALAFAFFLPMAVAQARPPAQPPIPHTLVGRTDCVSCHATGINGAPQYPASHTGWTSDMCRGCHVAAAAAPATSTAPSIATAIPTVTGQPAASGTPTAEASATPTPTETATATAAAPAATPPLIPHTLQGRDNCLACHGTGVGGAPKVPADHAGRTVDMCRGCHQPAQPAAGEQPQIVPTPIAVTNKATGESSCVTCHAGKGGRLAQGVKDWQSSIHAARGVGCENCHGGDPTSTDKAMSPEAGFVGVPIKSDIPALCASCHSRVELMRQYDLPTDQWSKYQQSVHGLKLAQGDSNVATCFTCHDGHATKEVTDTASQVYPSNVPALCSSCHSNAALMTPYGIQTDQYALYTKSVHGVALLEKQDLRAPNCASCHGTHGATPPGIQEVTNVCGSCHSATQDYYTKSAHASAGAGAPKCVTCHGQHDVMQPTDAIFTNTGARDCGSCHTGASAQTEMAQSIGKNIVDAAAAVDRGEHAIGEAAGSALIVAPEQVKLAEAKTNLITARAAQHALSLDTVKERTDKATAKANEVITDAQKAIAGSLFRREFMVFGLVVMALAIGSLYIIRRQLYKELPKE